MQNDKKLRVGIIGAGHFGRFHALKSFHNYRERLVGIYDISTKLCQNLAHEVKCVAFPSYDDLLNSVDAVIIATPAETHFDLALYALESGKHLLIEKPVSSTLKEAFILEQKARDAERVVQIGHLLRYSAEHEAITARIKKPLYIEATRLAPFKARGTDVSVVLDLMIHDLDFILSLIDSPIVTIDALGAAVSSPYEDIANARVRFENGSVATITASRISLKTERKMRLFAQEGYLSADFMARHLTFLNKEKGLPLPGSGGYRHESVSWSDHDNLAAEHDAFVASCLDGAPVLVDIQAGIRALDAALRVTENIHHSYDLMAQSGLLNRL